jgi:hypothetical protein
MKTSLKVSVKCAALSAIACLVFASVVFAAKPAKDATITPADQLKFTPLDPKQPDGLQIYVISGNMWKGPSTFYLKMKKGPSPLHTHTADYWGVNIKGTTKHWGTSGNQDSAPELEAGSIWHQPGKAIHGDSCESDECIVLLTFKGPFDFKMPDQKKK